MIFRSINNLESYNERWSEGMLECENVINQIISELFSINLLTKVERRQLFRGNRR